jgi:hypothetical protein
MDQPQHSPPQAQRIVQGVREISKMETCT